MASIEQGSINLGPGTAIGVNVLPYSIVGNGRTVVAVAGTQAALAGSTAVKTVTIRAFVSNTGLIYVGTTGVTSSNGFQLDASETVSLDIDNLSKIFLNAGVSGEGVSYIYLS